MSWDAVRNLAEEFRESLEKKLPDVYAEMQGIAEGAGLDLLDIVALNCRSEIAMGNFSDGCTSLSWKKHDNGRVLAQNWDWAPLRGRISPSCQSNSPANPKSLWLPRLVYSRSLYWTIRTNTNHNNTGWNCWKDRIQQRRCRRLSQRHSGETLHQFQDPHPCGSPPLS